MRNEIKLPDYLPSRYGSWLNLYRSVLASLQSQGIKPEDTTEIFLKEMFREDEYSCHETTIASQSWPLYVIKSRALDEVLPNLPTQKEVYQAIGRMRSDQAPIDFLERLFIIAKPD